MTTAPTFASAREAAEVVRAGLRFLAAADATAMAAETQAQCLQILEQATAMGTAARASILAAFTSGQGYSADADYSPKAWLIHKTGITKGAAVAHTAWVRRAAAHPQVAQALAGGEISESVARTICTWTDKLPGDCQEAADAILVTAAKAGMDVRDLAGLAGEIYARSLPDTPDDGKDEAFEDRSVKLETTFDGAGVLAGDLTPECASVVGAVLDALSAPAGAEDTRSQAQRYHDGLHEAMQRLVTAGLLPERAGQPVKALVHISLADLMVLDGSSALQEEWTSRVRALWAGHRAGASAGGSDGGAWLDGDAATAMACDAAMTPIVTGDVNPAAFDGLVRLCVELDRLRHHPGTGSGDGDGDGDQSDARPGHHPGLGSPRAGHHRQGGRPAVGSGRAGVVPAPTAAQRPAGRPEPAAGHRLRRDHPGLDPQRRHPAGQALPVGRPVQPARRGVPGPPRQAQGQRRQDQRQGLRAALLLPSPGGDPPLGLDPGPEPRRDHHRLEPGQNENPPQSQPTRPGRVRPGHAPRGSAQSR